MKKKTKEVLKETVFRIPFAGPALKRWRVNRFFSVERQVLQGKQPGKSSHPSIVFFTIHKAASSFIGNFMSEIIQGTGLLKVDLDGYFFELGKGKDWELGGRWLGRGSYSPNGYFYGPFRSFNSSITDLDKYKIVLVLRDPRDVIVSSYYSMHSHVMPRLAGEGEAEKRRKRRDKKIEQMPVDDYIIQKLQSTDRLNDVYLEYHRNLMGKPNVLFLKYEDMVTDFDPWLDRLTQFLGLDVKPGLLQQIRDRAAFKVSKEDVTKHKRQVTPGEHKRKLKPETIDFLNNYTKEVLKLFDYKL